MPFPLLWFFPRPQRWWVFHSWCPAFEGDASRSSGVVSSRHTLRGPRHGPATSEACSSLHSGHALSAFCCSRCCCCCGCGRPAWHSAGWTSWCRSWRWCCGCCGGTCAACGFRPPLAVRSGEGPRSCRGGSPSLFVVVVVGVFRARPFEACHCPCGGRSRRSTSWSRVAVVFAAAWLAAVRPRPAPLPL